MGRCWCNHCCGWSSLSCRATDPVPAKPRNALVMDLNLTLDPDPNFVVRGLGIDTRLAGELVLRRVSAKAPLQLTGTLRTHGGTYKAYGQALNIEQGLAAHPDLYIAGGSLRTP